MKNQEIEKKKQIVAWEMKDKREAGRIVDLEGKDSLRLIKKKKSESLSKALGEEGSSNNASVKGTHTALEIVRGPILVVLIFLIPLF